MVLWLFLMVSWVDLHCVSVVYPEHIHLHFCQKTDLSKYFFYKCLMPNLVSANNKSAINQQAHAGTE